MTRKSGVFATQPILDFGWLREGEKSEQLDFEVFTNIEKGIDIESVYVSMVLNILAVQEQQMHGLP